jgi:hypothetical protein
MAITMEDGSDKSAFSMSTTYNYKYKGVISYKYGKPYKMEVYTRLTTDSYSVNPSVEAEIFKNRVTKVKLLNKDKSYAEMDGIYNERIVPHGTITYFTSKNIAYKKEKYFAGIPIANEEYAQFCSTNSKVIFVEERTSQNIVQAHKYYLLTPTGNQQYGVWEYYVNDDKKIPVLARRDIYSNGEKIRSISYP